MSGNFACSCLWGDAQATYLRCFGDCEEGLFPRRILTLVTVLLDPAPSPRRAPRRDPPVVCPGFGLDSALEGTRYGCVMREQTRRRPTLPGPPRLAAPPCAARPAPPVMCSVFGFDKSKIVCFAKREGPKKIKRRCYFSFCGRETEKKGKVSALFGPLRCEMGCFMFLEAGRS